MEKKIYTTTDYSIFKKLKGNRDTKCVNKIVASIEKVGYMLSPILVNEKMEVIDGQNRLEALRKLEMPVDYMIQEGIGLEECRLLNIGQSNWRVEDYIVSYAEDGNKNYQRLMFLLAEHKCSFGLEGVLFFSNSKFIPRAGGAVFTFAKDGNFIITEEKYSIVRSRLESAKALGFVDFKIANNMLARPFWGAVAYAYTHEQVSVKELIYKLQENPKAIVSCGKVADQLMYFDDAYNRRKHPKNKVFMQTDFLQEKYLDK